MYLYPLFSCLPCALTIEAAAVIPTPPASTQFDDAARLRSSPAASWGAILAGSVAAVSVSLILVTLGAGLGFASASPWTNHGLSATSFTVASTIWLIVTQWLSAAAGGYLAGRLRHRWLATHTHEVFFRDTAHGLVTWGVATIFISAVLASSIGALVEGGAKAAQGVAVMDHSDMPEVRPMGPDSVGGSNGTYILDKLFRKHSSGNSPEANNQDPHGKDVRSEVVHIAAHAAMRGAVSDEDRAYLSALVASNAGVPADEAQRRVDAFIQSINDDAAKAKVTADEARKSAASAALYTALALLIGAFISSVSAAIGGRLRDEHL